MKSTRRRVPLAPLAALMLPLFPAACDTGASARAGPVVLDSAGVRVVVNETPAWSAGRAWRLSEVLRLELGAVDGEAPFLFDRIVGAVTLSDGRIVVADMGSAQVRFYDGAGRHLMSVGEVGEGPGEFRQVMGLQRLPGDTLAVLDRLERLHLFGPHGSYARTVGLGVMPVPVDPVTYQENPPSTLQVVGWLEDGSFLGRQSTALRLSPDRRFEEPQTLELTFGRFGPDASPRNGIVTVPGPTFHPHPLNLALRAVFGATVLAGTDGRRLILATSGDARIQWYDPGGGLRQVARREWSERPVTDAMTAAYVRRSSPPLLEDVARERTFARVLPTVSALLVDRDDNVWLRHYDPSHAATAPHYVPVFDGASTWSVVDPSGTWLGEVTMPGGFTPMEIGEGHVLGIHRDDVDVEYVRLYDLSREDR